MTHLQLFRLKEQLKIEAAYFYITYRMKPSSKQQKIINRLVDNITNFSLGEYYHSLKEKEFEHYIKYYSKTYKLCKKLKEENSD
jgi:hypothetical protein